MLTQKQSNQLVLVEMIEFLKQWFVDHIVTFEITLGEDI